MTIEVARKLLADTAVSMTDEQIQQLLSILSNAIIIGFEQFEKENKKRIYGD